MSEAVRPLTPAAVRRLTEPLIAATAELDRLYRRRELVPEIIITIARNAAKAGVPISLMKTAINSHYSRYLLPPIPLGDGRCSECGNVPAPPSPSVINRHINAIVEAGSELHSIFARVDSQRSMLSQMIQSAQCNGLPEKVIHDIVSSYRFFGALKDLPNSTFPTLRSKIEHQQSSDSSKRQP
jgi:hypothetical protein